MKKGTKWMRRVTHPGEVERHLHPEFACKIKVEKAENLQIRSCATFNDDFLKIRGMYVSKF